MATPVNPCQDEPVEAHPLVPRTEAQSIAVLTRARTSVTSAVMPGVLLLPPPPPPQFVVPKLSGSVRPGTTYHALQQLYDVL